MQIKETLLILFLAPFFSFAQHPTETKNKGAKNTSKITVTPSMSSLEVKNEVRDSSFIIVDYPKKYYSGFYKKSKPYNGYFKAGDRDVFWVNYYETGKKIKQYSYDIFDNLNEQEKKEIEYGYSENYKTVLNITSTFKNDNIVDGQIIEHIKNGYLSKRYNAGQLTAINIDAFAMHYYNRLSLKIVDDNIISSNFKDPISKVVISKKKDKLLVQLIAKGAVLASNNIDDCTQQKPKPNSIIRIFKTNNHVKCLIVNNNTNDMDDYRDNFSFLENLIFTNNFSSLKDKNNSEILEHYIKTIDTKNNREHVNMLLMAYMTTDKNGKIEDGIYWTEDTNTMGTYTTYKEGEIITTGKDNLQNFQLILDDFFNTL
ncbi:hypothetical protein [Olleya sp. HaHaR_3_96]|uniref:hypothetical protein n=1 Tax=Olleya sp. HaHaR_3_96 TaxID=2745560 RepID=UPI001C502159|nr:hypothetical protein [Olleya sp. HaHaR_3_96]QXP58605.1 hypothetical protein H0I26_11840 [Olleya sp. HaHaR_3_96]